jgi:hypothetical protein
MLFVANIRGLTDMNFKENPSNGSQGTAQKVHCCPRKVPFITDHSPAKSHDLERMYMEGQMTDF